MIRQMSNRLIRSSRLSASFSGEVVRFPRIPADQIAVNWQLARSLVTPLGTTSINEASAGGKSTFTSTLKVGDVPRAIHLSVAKEISRSETVYVEEGEFRGVLFRIVTGSPQTASAARGVLTTKGGFEGGITVLVSEDSEQGGEAFYDKTKKLLISRGISESLLQSTINDM